jgi:hypothetical protein
MSMGRPAAKAGAAPPSSSSPPLPPSRTLQRWRRESYVRGEVEEDCCHEQDHCISGYCGIIFI